jgi:subtilisin-like proprotein convertase family protein
MRRSISYWLQRLFSVLLAVVLFGGLAGMAPARAAALPPAHVVADAADAEALAWLAASGAERVADYGAFSLWRLPQANLMARTAQVVMPAGLRQTSTAIYLRGLTIQTGQAQPEAALPESLRQQASASGAELSIVQFIGPLQDAWLDALRAAGLEPVAYLPDDATIVWGADASARVAESAALAGLVQWQGAYHPGYRLAPELRSLTQAPSEVAAAVTVQVYNTPALPETLTRLDALALEKLSAPQSLFNLTDVRLRLPAVSLAEVAAWPDVFNIEPYSPPQLQDEIQGQLLAGNVTTSGGKVIPTAPGYLAWLATKGFPSDPAAYPVVDVTDDGIDQGDAANVLHPDFHVLGNAANPDRVEYIANCTNDATGNAVGGHGNLNAGIVGGYNNLAGFPYENTAGYQNGMGISPYGRVAGTKIFSNAGINDLSKCSSSEAVVVDGIYNRGGRITSDSWGSNVSGAYDATARLFDALTRDASTLQSGNQEMLHVFAAGNAGSSIQSTINSPGTAKNVLTVGASENVREQGVVDGCGQSSADNADDIATFSSRGFAADGRAKPDLIAPGTHIQGPASQDPAYTGGTVCNKYYPAGQTLYAWSSGTSHATPAVAGAAQLAYEYYRRVLAPGQTPSPAMLKALLLNSPRYMNGLDSGGTLPGSAQGWGMLNLGNLFDGQPRMIVDQAQLLGNTGANYTLNGSVANPALPLRVSLVWTDAPGSTVAAHALVNNLDLEVTVGGVTYKGNNFSGEFSSAGGTVDSLNNVENVFLPAGMVGGIQVKVLATNLAGDGVPGNGDPTDQDFALVISNATSQPTPILSVGAVRWYPVTGIPNPYPEPGDTLDLEVELSDAAGAAPALNVSAVLSLTQGAASLLQAASVYPNMLGGASVTNAPRFRVTIDPSQICGGMLGLSLTVTFTGGQVVLALPPQVTAMAVRVEKTVYSGPPVLIPPYSLTTPLPGNALLNAAGSGTIIDLDVTVNITHTFIGDLEVSLIGLDGYSLLLADRRGSNYHNYTNITFDDEATQAIANSPPPFSGSYRPEQALSLFDAMAPGGTWTLSVLDKAPGDTGEIVDFTLNASLAVCSAAAYYLPVVGVSR